MIAVPVIESALLLFNNPSVHLLGIFSKLQIPQSSALSLSSRLNEIALEPLPQSHSQTYNHPPLQSQVPPSTLAEQGFSIPPRDKSDIDNLRQSASELERKNHELQGNIHSQRAQQNAILNEKQALVRFKAKMDSEVLVWEKQ